jgi:hypothetical protein
VSDVNAESALENEAATTPIMKSRGVRSEECGVKSLEET